jgi:hypothetical protein
MERHRGKFFLVSFSIGGFLRLIGTRLLEDAMANEQTDGDGACGGRDADRERQGDGFRRRCDQVDEVEEPALDTI